MTVDAKLKPRHFSFRIKYRKINLASWLEYYKHKRAKKHSEYNKFFLKEFRTEIKKQEFKVVVTHTPSRLKAEFIVDAINRKDLMKQVREKIKAMRKELFAPKVEQRDFEGAKYELVGGVMLKGASINPMSKFLKINDPLSSKKPRTPYKNYIGVELEFNNVVPGSSTKTIAEALKNANLARYVSVGIDHSCGYEVRVLLEESNFEEPLKKIMALIIGMGFTVSENCGTHVHLDMRNRDVKKVYRNLVMSQSFLRKFLTKSRKKNKFCKVNRNIDFDEQCSAQNTRANDARYYGINALAYKTHHTLEIRMHQGTLDFDVICPYIKMLVKLVNYKGALEKPVSTLKQAKAQYEIDPALSITLAHRIGTLFGRVFTTKEVVNV